MRFPILKPASIAHIEDVLCSVISERAAPKLPRQSAMVPIRAELETARRHVLHAEKAVVAQRTRVERLHSNGLPTLDAEKLLVTFENVLGVMRKHLAVEETF